MDRLAALAQLAAPEHGDLKEISTYPETGEFPNGLIGQRSHEGSADRRAA
jgi:hypothetical protein